ncbi:OmpA family protein [Streptomyces sp. ACA25]|uniref:OmpA family protein n=1 Tax=Streptomyces sp. ACA25 TaxID=3022596 RepID=UPI0023072206|nr:OmpA family protein [Streptomyces sp. ACA25]MDB1086940.1 OmpA family protein [Streptomyces sp. ACA25]
MAGTAMLALSTPAWANEVDDFEQPPGYEAPPLPEIDMRASGLKLGDGATLAEPRVLDIKFITEDIGEPVQSDDGSTTGDDAVEEDSLEVGAGGAEEPADEEEAEDSEEGEGDGGAGEQHREERTGDLRKFTLQTDVLFGKDSDEVSEETRKALKVVAEALDEHRPERVNIFGFTDNLGPYEHGIPLSENRAKNTHAALLDLLDDASGIRFNVRGYSEDYPLYDNDTEEGRQKNRRVEISWPSGA